MKESKIVFYSETESDVLGLKVSRCNEYNFDEQQLMHEIIDGEYDICRLKIPSEDEMASQKLYSAGFPFFFSGSIRRYKTLIDKKDEGDFLHPQMTYEIYDGTQDSLLKNMLIGTWGTYPIGYYRTPYLSDLITKEMEIQSVFSFYKKNNLHATNPNNSIVFMNDNGKYVGFFALNKVDGNLESHIGGILEPYRKDGYFLDMLRYIKNYCINQKLQYFIFGARNENAYVQKIFQDVGFKAIGSENVFHITPMLSRSQLDDIVIENTENLNFHTDYLNLIKESTNKNLLDIREPFIPKNINIVNSESFYNNENNTVTLKTPILNEDYFLNIITIKNKVNNTSKAIIYVKNDFKV